MAAPTHNWKNTMSRSLPPNVLIASRIMKQLESLPIESQRTILHFVHQSVEEGFQQSQRIALTELGNQAAVAAQGRMHQAAE